MAKQFIYEGLIPQNIAPKGAVKIVISDSKHNRINDIPLGGLERPQDEKIYSFGLLADIHCAGTNSPTKTFFDNALTYFEQQNCEFCCHAGDMTNIGFHEDTAEHAYNNYQFAEYKSICDNHPYLPVYGCCGNHENYGINITCCLDDLFTYANIPSLYYAVEFNDDVFIFLSQPVSYKPMPDEALPWLQNMLEKNKNRRCFIFVHSFIDKEDSGNPYNAYQGNIFDSWGQDKKESFVNIVKQYNTLVFHGHSHFHPQLQEEVSNTNYSNLLGFHSVHVPSCAYYRTIEHGEKINYFDNGYGYVVDVYKDYIILNGFNTANNKTLPIANYKIDFANKNYTGITTSIATTDNGRTDNCLSKVDKAATIGNARLDDCLTGTNEVS